MQHINYEYEHSIFQRNTCVINTLHSSINQYLKLVQQNKKLHINKLPEETNGRTPKYNEDLVYFFKKKKEFQHRILQNNTGKNIK